MSSLPSNELLQDSSELMRDSSEFMNALYILIKKNKFYAMFIYTIIICFITIGFWLSVSIICFILYKHKKHSKFQFLSLNNELKYDSYKHLCKYGDYKIKKVSIIYQPIAFIYKILIDFITFGKYSCNFKDKHFNHVILMFDLIDDNKKTHKIFVDKLINGIRIKTNLTLNETQKINKIPIQSKNLKFKDVINQTINRVGKKTLCSWNHFDNNCYDLVNEIFKTLNVSENFKSYKYHKNEIKSYKSALDNTFSKWYIFASYFVINLTLRIVDYSFLIDFLHGI